MKIKKVAFGIVIAAVAGAVLATGIHYLATRDPTAIKVDPRRSSDAAIFADLEAG